MDVCLNDSENFTLTEEALNKIHDKFIDLTCTDEDESVTYSNVKIELVLSDDEDKIYLDEYRYRYQNAFTHTDLKVENNTIEASPENSGDNEYKIQRCADKEQENKNNDGKDKINNGDKLDFIIKKELLDVNSDYLNHNNQSETVFENNVQLNTELINKPNTELKNKQNTELKNKQNTKVRKARKRRRKYHNVKKKKVNNRSSVALNQSNKKEDDNILIKDESEINDIPIDSVKVELENQGEIQITSVKEEFQNDNNQLVANSANETYTMQRATTSTNTRRKQNTTPNEKRIKKKNEPPILNSRDRDIFCWKCHKFTENVLSCTKCVRIFHIKCSDSFDEESADFICCECVQFEKKINTSFLAKLLTFVLNRVRENPDSTPFELPVDTNEYPDYNNYIVQPMCLSLLQNNIENLQYECCEQFIADFKWIVHSSCVYNSSISKLTNTARSMLRSVASDCKEITLCSDCFYRAVTLQHTNWFTEPCEEPHLLIWAKLQGFPFWPCKMLGTTIKGIDVRFFGDHNKSIVSVKSCYLYSKRKLTKSKMDPDLLYAINEAQLHINKLQMKFGKFGFAENKTLLNLEQLPSQKALQLPFFYRTDTENNEISNRIKISNSPIYLSVDEPSYLECFNGEEDPYDNDFKDPETDPLALDSDSEATAYTDTRDIPYELEEFTSIKTSEPYYSNAQNMYTNSSCISMDHPNALTKFIDSNESEEIEINCDPQLISVFSLKEVFEEKTEVSAPVTTQREAIELNTQPHASKRLKYNNTSNSNNFHIGDSLTNQVWFPHNYNGNTSSYLINEVTDLKNGQSANTSTYSQDTYIDQTLSCGPVTRNKCMLKRTNTSDIPSLMTTNNNNNCINDDDSPNPAIGIHQAVPNIHVIADYFESRNLKNVYEPVLNTNQPSRGCPKGPVVFGCKPVNVKNKIAEPSTIQTKPNTLRTFVSSAVNIANRHDTHPLKCCSCNKTYIHKVAQSTSVTEASNSKQCIVTNSYNLNTQKTGVVATRPTAISEENQSTEASAIEKKLITRTIEASNNKPCSIIKVPYTTITAVSKPTAINNEPQFSIATGSSLMGKEFQGMTFTASNKKPCLSPSLLNTAEQKPGTTNRPTFINKVAKCTTVTEASNSKQCITTTFSNSIPLKTGIVAIRPTAINNEAQFSKATGSSIMGKEFQAFTASNKKPCLSPSLLNTAEKKPGATNRPTFIDKKAQSTTVAEASNSKQGIMRKFSSTISQKSGIVKTRSTAISKENHSTEASTNINKVAKSTTVTEASNSKQCITTKFSNSNPQKTGIVAIRPTAINNDAQFSKATGSSIMGKEFQAITFTASNKKPCLSPSLLNTAEQKPGATNRPTFIDKEAQSTTVREAYNSKQCILTKLSKTSAPKTGVVLTRPTAINNGAQSSKATGASIMEKEFQAMTFTASNKKPCLSPSLLNTAEQKPGATNRPTFIDEEAQSTTVTEASNSKQGIMRKLSKTTAPKTGVVVTRPTAISKENQSTEASEIEKKLITRTIETSNNKPCSINKFPNTAVSKPTAINNEAQFSKATGASIMGKEFQAMSFTASNNEPCLSPSLLNTAEQKPDATNRPTFIDEEAQSTTVTEASNSKQGIMRKLSKTTAPKTGVVVTRPTAISKENQSTEASEIEKKLITRTIETSNNKPCSINKFPNTAVSKPTAINNEAQFSKATGASIMGKEFQAMSFTASNNEPCLSPSLLNTAEQKPDATNRPTFIDMEAQSSTATKEENGASERIKNIYGYASNFSSPNNDLYDFFVKMDEIINSGRFEEAELDDLEQQIYKFVSDVICGSENDSLSNVDNKKFDDIKKKINDHFKPLIEKAKTINFCKYCLSKEAEFYCCDNAYYCSEKCQNENWKTHQKNCRQDEMLINDERFRFNPKNKNAIQKFQNTVGVPEGYLNHIYQTECQNKIPIINKDGKVYYIRDKTNIAISEKPELSLINSQIKNKSHLVSPSHCTSNNSWNEPSTSGLNTLLLSQKPATPDPPNHELVKQKKHSDIYSPTCMSDKWIDSNKSKEKNILSFNTTDKKSCLPKNANTPIENNTSSEKTEKIDSSLLEKELLKHKRSNGTCISSTKPQFFSGIPTSSLVPTNSATNCVYRDCSTQVDPSQFPIYTTACSVTPSLMRKVKMKNILISPKMAHTTNKDVTSSKPGENSGKALLDSQKSCNSSAIKTPSYYLLKPHEISKVFNDKKLLNNKNNILVFGNHANENVTSTAYKSAAYTQVSSSTSQPPIFVTYSKKLKGNSTEPIFQTIRKYVPIMPKSTTNNGSTLVSVGCTAPSGSVATYTIAGRKRPFS